MLKGCCHISSHSAGNAAWQFNFVPTVLEFLHFLFVQFYYFISLLLFFLHLRLRDRMSHECMKGRAWSNECWHVTFLFLHIALWVCVCLRLWESLFVSCLSVSLSVLVTFCPYFIGEKGASSLLSQPYPLRLKLKLISNNQRWRIWAKALT